VSDAELPAFEALPPSRMELLRRRAEGVTAVVPSYAEMRRHLLELGGLEVVAPPFDTSSETARRRQEYEIARTLDAGRAWAGRLALLEPIERSNCHINVARLRVAGRGDIATGWALAEDGLWREHSWLVQRPASVDGALIETTRPWLLYYGYVLGAEEADRFVRAELGPDALSGM
jgi:hypothetical protein